MQKVKLFFLYAAIIVCCCAVKPAPRPAMHWLNVDEAVAALQKENKPVLIDLYTDWCGWCKVMDRKTYSNSKVSAYIQDKFYPVKINAETRDKITWKGKTYSFDARYRSNEFAVYLTGGRLEFPTTIFLPANGDAPQAIPGYLEPKDLELIVKYFGEGAYGKTPFEDYRKTFSPTW